MLPSYQYNAKFELSDGTSLTGYSFGAPVSASGEAVFTTAMVGYPESLTDPSYTGQILVLTFPMIGNYGVPDATVDPQTHLMQYMESESVCISGLVVQDYSHNYSHYQAVESLSSWLCRHNIPAIYAIDTRYVTKKLREAGEPLLARIIVNDQQVPFCDPNTQHLVARVSCQKVIFYEPTQSVRSKYQHQIHTVMVIDCGIKHGILRCLLDTGLRLKRVPWNYDFINDQDYDALFISNGPGNPEMCQELIHRLRFALQQSKPIFGICLGAQLIALAAGGTTAKMPYGNRGHNQPCLQMVGAKNSKTCFITSQNHGYHVNTIPTGWKELFKNANDNTNEGIICEDKPFFTCQFHPEAQGGPLDTLFLFDVFRSNIDQHKNTLHANPNPSFIPLTQPQSDMVKQQVHKVLVLGSGGLTIGQAGEFDYSGSQALKALKEEGIYTVLINPNIATVQTSPGMADQIYFVPVTPEYVESIIIKEKVDAILLSVGGQTALNCGIQLWDRGILQKYHVQVLGTTVDTIKITEDRELFKQSMEQIGEHVAPCQSANNVSEALIAAQQIGYPVIVRGAFCLGGLGSGFANNDQELIELATKAFITSSQVLIDKSLKGWKEIEYEVVRDCYDNCITVCNMENFDPCGVHTGESIVIAPSQTLTNDEYHKLRATSIKVIRHLKVVGECNIQYAVHPQSKQYCIIEVNARLSRSSALASKATGYPLAWIAAKLSLRYDLPCSLKNSVTQVTTACFEPSLDYCVVKMPKWDFNKFENVSRQIGSAMKSVGEVMAIGRTFEEAMQKAIRMVYQKNDMDQLLLDWAESNPVQQGQEIRYQSIIDEELKHPTDQRFFAIAFAMVHLHYSVDLIHQLTQIDKWFLYRVQSMLQVTKVLQQYSLETIPKEVVLEAKRKGYSDAQIAKALQTSEVQVREWRWKHQVIPIVKQIDTLAAEFPSKTNYLYTTYHGCKHDVSRHKQEGSILILGSGPYRIGSSVEFDYSGVMCSRALRKLGYKTIYLNCNPETVSTDFDQSDRLYFDELSMETVLDIYHGEHARGVIVCVGGQQANNLALELHQQGVTILGTSAVDIDKAENRKLFSALLDQIQVDQPEWTSVHSVEDAKLFAKQVGYPVLIRPSYVLSGAAMRVVENEKELVYRLKKATIINPQYPVVISKFLNEAKEIEVDGVGCKGQLVVHAICEHVEYAGVHSGDATLVCPPFSLPQTVLQQLQEATEKICSKLHITGPFNIQFLYKENQIKVIECNLRASRSLPFVSKTLNIDFVEIATRAIMGQYETTTIHHGQQETTRIGVKSPMFSFKRLAGADPKLGVEMASTGEVACFGTSVEEAFLKSLQSSGVVIHPFEKSILLSSLPQSESQRNMIEQSLLVMHTAMHYTIYSTIPFSQNKWIQEITLQDALQRIANKQFGIVLNVACEEVDTESRNGYLLRRGAVDFGVTLFNNFELFHLFAQSLLVTAKTGLPAVAYDHY